MRRIYLSLVLTLPKWHPQAGSSCRDSNIYFCLWVSSIHCTLHTALLHLPDICSLNWFLISVQLPRIVQSLRNLNTSSWVIAVFFDTFVTRRHGGLGLFMWSGQFTRMCRWSERTTCASELDPADHIRWQICSLRPLARRTEFTGTPDRGISTLYILHLDYWTRRPEER